MPTVEFPDGTRLSAESWDKLLKRWRSKRWNRHMDEGKFRRVLARRAIVWSGDAYVHPQAVTVDLFEQLEEAGMLTIVDHR